MTKLMGSRRRRSGRLEKEEEEEEEVGSGDLPWSLRQQQELKTKGTISSEGNNNGGGINQEER